MKDWTEKEEEYLKQSYPSYSISIEDICKHLKRSYDSIMKKAQRMFLKRDKNNELNSSNNPLFNLNDSEEHSFFTEKYKPKNKDNCFQILET